jgi:hypothetical protein
MAAITRWDINLTRSSDGAWVQAWCPNHIYPNNHVDQTKKRAHDLKYDDVVYCYIINVVEKRKGKSKDSVFQKGKKYNEIAWLIVQDT